MGTVSLGIMKYEGDGKDIVSAGQERAFIK